MKAMIIGATGLVGSELTKILEANMHYEELVLVGRDLSKLEDFNSRKISFSEYHLEVGIDHVYCCLGTTIKDAGSKEKFKSVDHDLVVELAKWCSKNSVKKLGIVSAIGSNKNSPFFYNKVKGEMEENTKKAFSSSVFVNPSLLLGNRDHSRFLEDIGQGIAPILNTLLLGPLKKYQAVRAEDVARELYTKVVSNQ